MPRPFAAIHDLLNQGHPTGAKPGNWYSSEPVSVESELIGKEMLAWLKPSNRILASGIENPVCAENLKSDYSR
jgi:hypothetical protein